MNNESDYLVHYGVLGMKWGRRKKSYKYSSKGERTKKVKKKSNHRLRLEEKYRKAGYNKEESEKKANTRIRTEKILAAAAVVSLATVVGMKINSRIMEEMDTTVKMGEVLQRVEGSSSGKLHENFYASLDKRDKVKYKGLFGGQNKVARGQAFVMELETKSDVRVAGKRAARDTFRNLYENDPDFRRKLAYKKVGKQTKLNEFEMDKLYDRFNQSLVQRSTIQDPTGENINKFYKALKDKGYGAVVDMNDKHYSGYNAKNPLIFIGQNKNVNRKSFREMPVAEIKDNLAKSAAMMLVENSYKVTIPAAGIGALGMYRQDMNGNSFKVKQKKTDERKSRK